MLVRMKKTNNFNSSQKLILLISLTLGISIRRARSLVLPLPQRVSNLKDMYLLVFVSKRGLIAIGRLGGHTAAAKSLQFQCRLNATGLSGLLTHWERVRTRGLAFS